MNSLRLRGPALALGLLCVLLPSLGPVGCSSGSPPEAEAAPRIAFVTNNASDFWVLARKGVEDAAAALGVNASVHMPTGGVADQKRVLEDLLVKGVDGIAVSPIDPGNQTEFLDTVAARTALVPNDSDAPDSARRCFIGVDNYEAGWLCGDLIAEALPEGGKVAIFVGRMEQDNARRRRQGIIDRLTGRERDPSRFDPPGSVIDGGGYSIIGTYTDQIDYAKAKANAEDVLTRHSDIGVLVGLFGYNTPMILEALDGAGKRGRIPVVGFDEEESTLVGIEDGAVHGTVVQNPYQYGYRSVELLRAYATGADAVAPADGFLNVPARAVRQADLEEFRADLAKKLGRE
ncbi:MAG: sugar-binding protein [Planctomycetota bacterium]